MYSNVLQHTNPKNVDIELSLEISVLWSLEPKQEFNSLCMLTSLCEPKAIVKYIE